MTGVISHYEVLEKLGEGGMGVIYKCRDTRLDRIAALKVLPAAAVADASRKRRFVQEATVGGKTSSDPELTSDKELSGESRRSLVNGLVDFFTLVAALLVPVNLGAQTFDRSDAVGRKVRVIATDGSRATARLVSLSDTEVVIRRDDHEQRFALTKVERVERVRHHARNLAVWGALAGAVAGGLVGAANTSDTTEIAAGTAFISGIGAGAGAGIGALINAATRDGNVLYQTPRGARSVSVSPIVSSGHPGVALTMRW